MKRRDTLKTIVLSGAGAGLVLTGCKTESSETDLEQVPVAAEGYGRTPEEKEHDAKLMSETFFTENELATVKVLSDLIIPADESGPSASEVGVPDFIEFMMKDYPPFQTRMRGGLMWLDHQTNELVNLTFTEADTSTQTALLDRIAYPEEAAPEDAPGVKFFNLMRNLTATGYYTSQEGIKVLGYKGNIPNVWDGVPQEVLDKHKLAYEEKYKSIYLKPEDRNQVIQWDEEGNIIG